MPIIIASLVFAVTLSLLPYVEAEEHLPPPPPPANPRSKQDKKCNPITFPSSGNIECGHLRDRSDSVSSDTSTSSEGSQTTELDIGERKLRPGMKRTETDYRISNPSSLLLRKRCTSLPSSPSASNPNSTRSFPSLSPEAEVDIIFPRDSKA
ncbi:hypothetical protein TREMEDRAFT_60355 [Tremella mesenterica DSM 1558]|uniref:uncharacterized protein n=1 Tax=Tremella mesenterica (strain ATCC 24925 / CBS 8224 / DSM 1558 / NBRC 9311 / NRRL Y-6157 / RJB 2259-6 / UBC 559-6) TaxID=578456 RepID=UPI0003F4A331|nr:uncharacterized protein TREMEDRAFT_60355 [Tremella mesenterica DSM 1558]EIW71426.1 hypothetical protein TREMEDRAFT_60355 [Tremella mesenterica DSM 1558]